jgi:hypothetical protein
VTGYEFYTLYQAVQYYDMVLDRFYGINETMWRLLAEPAPVIDKDTVVSYLERVLRASAQRSRALACCRAREIAEIGSTRRPVDVRVARMKTAAPIDAAGSAA